MRNSETFILQSFELAPKIVLPSLDGPGGKEFSEFKADAESSCGVVFHSSVPSLPPVPENVRRLVLISGRTADNPRIMAEAIKVGCHCIYLEKPGAPTVAELAVMKSQAAAANVSVWMGYNKNVCKYVSKTRDFAASVKDGHVTFVSNNSYSPTAESLGECFERNSEGMLKNMAIHELALLVSFYDVTVDNIESVVADASFSSLQTLPGPSGKLFTDFDKIKFTITTKNGKQASVQADRCGGSVSYATVTNSAGEELFRHSMPDAEDEENVAVLQAAFPGAMPYFFSQDPDYATLKERVAAFCATGAEPTGVATIDIAYETLRVAEYLVPLLQEQLKGCANA